MNKKSAIAVYLCTMLLAGCSNLSILAFSTATPSPTVTPSITPTNTPVPTETPTPTVTPRPAVTIEPYSNAFPLDWQLQPLSAEQIKQVKDCDIEKLAEQRYPEQIKTDELIYRFEPVTSCEWATLAFAYASRVADAEKIPEMAKNAFGKAISENTGFAFSTPLFYRFFFDAFPIVRQPPLFEQEITRVKITYTWGGIGEPVNYEVDIRQANTDPVVVVSRSEPATIRQNLKTTIDKESVQALGKSLTNLLPIQTQFSLMPCTDNNPDWTITITLKDGTPVELKTNGSNMIYMGDPWQTSIDGQDYVQFSVEFIAALDKVIQAIGLPYGQPMGMFCAAENVLEKAYP